MKTLSDYLKTPGATQTALAKAVGVTQGAIFHMLRSNREIYVIENPDGSLELQEIKRIAASA